MAHEGIRMLRIGKQIRNVGRLGQIATTFGRHGFGSLMEQINLESLLPYEFLRKLKRVTVETDSIKSEASVLACHFRQALEELGPAFVKLGQLFSMREDLLPATFIEQLKKLHNQVEPVAFDDIQALLNESLGERLSDFESINPKPLASGSIGQVHQAHLKSGNLIVLKVQRPHIAQQINTDLDLMELIAGLVERHIPELRSFKPLSLVLEFKRSILSELDFVREGASTSRIANNFVGKSQVSFPEVYWQYSNQKVLALSYLEGIPVSNRSDLLAKGYNPKQILNQAVSAFLQMVFVDGFYHGDLHPGNIYALNDSRLGLLDFGVTIKISNTVRRHLAGLLICLVKEDYEGMVRHFVELSDPGSNFDYQAFANQVANEFAPYMGLRLKEIRTGKILWSLATISARFDAPMPNELAMFLRTIATLEGVAKELDPYYDIMAACQSFTNEFSKEVYTPENINKEVSAILLDTAYLLRSAPYQIRRLLKHTLEGDLQLQIKSDSLSQVGKTVDRAATRLALSLIIASLIMACAVFSHDQSLTADQRSLVMGLAIGILCIFLTLFFWSMAKKN